MELFSQLRAAEVADLQQRLARLDENLVVSIAACSVLDNQTFYGEMGLA
jgi:hypothetical protein